MDPRLALTLSVSANPGVYALLLGSGVSRSAEIPTGWEITLDLIRRLAVAEGQEAADPLAWHREAFGEEPEYSRLLERLGRTAAERQALLRAYFEPTDAERQEGVKAPTPAHIAIARLSAAGYVRAIVTTNFDRLLELALETEGVRPVVVSTQDAARGAIPVVHADCYVLKINGDYLDTRIRNTEDELAKYPKALRDLLDRIFDEYGLIVCGWSGEWDPALRAALTRGTGRRYSTYWTARSELSEMAADLARHRDATLVPIEGADEFFRDLEARVSSQARLGRPHPLSVESAAVTLKRLLRDPSGDIELRDLVHRETERVHAVLLSDEFGAGAKFSNEELHLRVSKYEAAVAVLARMVAVGAYWFESGQAEVWRACVERAANATPGQTTGLVAWVELWRYPATVLLYAAGVVALERRHYHLLYDLLIAARVQDRGEEHALVRSVNAWVVEPDVARRLPNLERRTTPVSDHLYGAVREHVVEFLPAEAAYQAAFDIWEYFLALVYANDYGESFGPGLRGPVGCFSWRSAFSVRRASERLAQESIEIERAGFFRGQEERLKEVISEFNVFQRGRV